MIRKSLKQRISIFFILVVIVLFSISLKLMYEQIFHYDFIVHKAHDLWERDFPFAGKRGTIYDRNQQVLAQDVETISLMLIPSQVKDKRNIARQLSGILQMDETYLFSLMGKKASIVKIMGNGRHLSNQQIQSIKKLKMSGVYFVQDSKRYYPKKKFLAQVLGFSGGDHQGLAGLELQLDNYLQAKPGMYHIPVDAKGNTVHVYGENYEKKGLGMDVVLTIDDTIQKIVERELNIMMKKYEPNSVLALAMNPNTGAIYACASKPDFDPNHYQKYSSEIYNRNLPIWMSYEPGSTFKSVTFSSALDLNCFDMFKDKYFDKGYEMVDGAKIKSWKVGGHGLQTFLQVLENSSNPGFVEIARRMGKDHLYDYVTRFGFGKKSGIELPGEAGGIMFKKNKFNEVEQATVAFGQGLSVTPIQLVTAFSAVINGGNLYKPYIVQSINHPITKEAMIEYKPIKKYRVIKKSTSKKMRYALESVVANGGGMPSYIKGYRIGGKSGTAQKAENGKYSKTNYIVSFIAAAPMQHPEIVLYIACDSPKNDLAYGSVIAAPAVKKCLEDILPYMHIQHCNKQIPKKIIWPESENPIVKNFIGKTKKEVKQAGINFIFYGDGNTVKEQMPEAGVVLSDKNKEVWIYLE